MSARPNEKTTTAEALLGLLSIKPMSGYEIRGMIQQSIGNFWSESFGQIYPALKGLERDGLIVAERETPSVEDAGRPSRRFRLTEAGRLRLREWLAVLAKPQVPRNELLLKLFFGAEGSTTTMREQIAATRAVYAADLQRYEFIVAKLQQTRAHLAGFPYWMMTVRYGQAEARAMLAWADESLAALDEVEMKGETSSGSTRRSNHAQ